MDQLRPLPYKEKNIVDISSQDSKLVVSGMIIDKDNESLILDDGTSQIKVQTQENFPINTYIRVYGRLSYPDELQADIIQDISKIDKLLYKKVKEMLIKKEV